MCSGGGVCVVAGCRGGGGGFGGGPYLCVAVYPLTERPKSETFTDVARTSSMSREKTSTFLGKCTGNPPKGEGVGGSSAP